MGLRPGGHVSHARDERGVCRLSVLGAAYVPTAQPALPATMNGVLDDTYRMDDLELTSS